MSTREYGVFNAEGCIERGFYTRVLADVVAMRYLTGGDIDAYAAELCPDHEEQPRDTCEDCATDTGEVTS